jgi:transposase
VLLEEGLSLSEVARRVQASVGSVFQWRQAWQTGGEAALAPKPVPGRPRKLTDEQRQQLLQLLLQGARANGFPNELWTLRRIAAVIQVQFGVRYHPSPVWKVLRGLGWSCQVPERRAIQRDEKAMAQWKRSKWPAIKKSPPSGSLSRLPGGEWLSAHPDAPPDLVPSGADPHRAIQLQT